MWRCIAGSVTGPSHAKNGAPCQDSQRVQVLTRLGAGSLVACVADGAGSASMSQDGSAMACEVVVQKATEHYDANEGSFAGVDREQLLAWVSEARDRIISLAEARESTPREFATTLCVACVSPSGSIFAQIGDGVIVARQAGALGVVFWPQSGEYANSTNFLTDPHFEKHLQFTHSEAAFEDLALMTDGVERVALSFESQTPHGPFFDPLFSALRSAPNHEALNPELTRFLDSESIKSRSDDDKTVVLAVHVEE